jgi:hypothetical protein
MLAQLPRPSIALTIGNATPLPKSIPAESPNTQTELWFCAEQNRGNIKVITNIQLFI